jgi:hypothetical protein
LVEPVFDPTPVPVNPVTNRIGDTTIEAQIDSSNAGLLIAQSAVLATAGVLKSFSFYITTSVGQLTLALYDATGTGGIPGNLLSSTAPFTPTTGWNTVSVTSQFITAGIYWLVYQVSSNLMTFPWQTTTGVFYYANQLFGTFPVSFPLGYAAGTGGWSFYATVISGGTIALPSWLDPGEAAYLQGLIAAGYTFSDLHGPYGTDFKRSYLQQLLGCTANLTAIRAAGFNKNLVAAEWDVRSPQAFMAMYHGAYIYGDGPLYPYRQVMNGKSILG